MKEKVLSPSSIWANISQVRVLNKSCNVKLKIKSSVETQAKEGIEMKSLDAP